MPRRRQQNSSTFQQRAIQGGGGSLGSDIQALNSATQNEIFAREQLDAERNSKNLAINTVRNEDRFFADRDEFEREELDREALELGRAGSIEDISNLVPGSEDYGDQLTSILVNMPPGMMDDPAFKHIFDQQQNKHSDFKREEAADISRGRLVEANTVNDSRVLSTSQKSLAQHDIAANDSFDREQFRDTYQDAIGDIASTLYSSGHMDSDELDRYFEIANTYGEVEDSEIGTVAAAAEDLAELQAKYAAAKGDRQKEAKIRFDTTLTTLKARRSGLATFATAQTELANKHFGDRDPKVKEAAIAANTAAKRAEAEVIEINKAIEAARIQYNVDRKPPVRPVDTNTADSKTKISQTPEQSNLSNLKKSL